MSFTPLGAGHRRKHCGLSATDAWRRTAISDGVENAPNPMK